MILVDTSVWVAHLRERNEALARLLNVGAVCIHPYLVGEIALGRLRHREPVLNALSSLPGVTISTPSEIRSFIERHALFGRGVGFVDVCLLAATALTANTRL